MSEFHAFDLIFRCTFCSRILAGRSPRPSARIGVLGGHFREEKQLLSGYFCSEQALKQGGNLKTGLKVTKSVVILTIFLEQS